MQSIHSDQEYEEECKEQFRNMTGEQTGQHIGLEKVRNIITGVDENYGIDTIRKLVEKIKRKRKKLIETLLECDTELRDGKRLY